MTLTLKQLLDEVETARTGIRIRHTEAMVRDLDRYEKELMPELARSLKRLSDGAREYIDDVTVHTCDGSASCKFCELKTILSEIENPPNYPVVKNATQSCPNCERRFMARAEKSHGWYCKDCGVFLPDECV